MIKKLLITFVLLVVLAATALFFFGGTALNSGIRKLVVEKGPALTGTEIQLESVSLSALGGSGRISALVIGNPTGFSTEKAMSLGSSELQIAPLSLFGDTIEIKRIAIDAPEIILEQANGTTNLQQIQKNIEKAIGPRKPREPSAPEEAESGPGKKLSIGEFVLSNAKVTIVAFGQNRAVTLPTIRLTELGTKEGGLPPTEIAKEVMAVVMREVGKQAQQLGMQFLQDPSGSMEATQQQINSLREQAKGQLKGASEAADALRGLLDGGKKKKEPASGGE